MQETIQSTPLLLQRIVHPPVSRSGQSQQLKSGETGPNGMPGGDWDSD